MIDEDNNGHSRQELNRKYKNFEYSITKFLKT